MDRKSTLCIHMLESKSDPDQLHQLTCQLYLSFPVSNPTFKLAKLCWWSFHVFEVNMNCQSSLAARVGAKKGGNVSSQSDAGIVKIKPSCFQPGVPRAITIPIEFIKLSQLN